MSDEKLNPILKTALNLDGSPQAIKNFYAGWAETYEKQTTSWDYAAPSTAVQLMKTLSSDDAVAIDPGNKKIEIVDAGCGTGLLAKLLDDQGYCAIDGFDISEEMVELAKPLGIYRNLNSNVDINLPVRNEWTRKYDCTISVGVFTPGHVPPSSLSHLIDLTRAGGIIITSTRIAYYESENYQKTADQFEADGKIKLLTSLKNAPYTTDERAHYWVYAAL